MKSLTIIISIAFLLLSFPCSAQDDVTIERMPISKEDSLKIEQMGIRIFNLYRTEAYDTLIEEFFPSQQTALAFVQQVAIPEDHPDLLRLKNNFDQVKMIAKATYKRSFEKDKELYNIQFDQLKIDSVNSKKGKEVQTNFEFLGIVIYCRDNQRSYKFLIQPVIVDEDKWYLFDTDLIFLLRK